MWQQFFKLEFLSFLDGRNQWRWTFSKPFKLFSSCILDWCYCLEGFTHSLLSLFASLVKSKWMMQANSGNFGCSSLNFSTVNLSMISIWRHPSLLVGYFITLKKLNVTSSSCTRRGNFSCWTSIKVLQDTRKSRAKIRGIYLSLSMSNKMKSMGSRVCPLSKAHPLSLLVGIWLTCPPIGEILLLAFPLPIQIS